MIINPKSKNEYSQNSEEIIAMELLARRPRRVPQGVLMTNDKWQMTTQEGEMSHFPSATLGGSQGNP